MGAVKILLKPFLIITLFFFILAPTLTRAEPDDSLPTSPCRKQGEKWRIGYLQGGDYASYRQSLVAMVEGLMRLGWIGTRKIPTEQNTKELWQWLSTELESDYLQFVADAWYDAEWWKERRPLVRQEIIDRCNKINDIDLIVAMGTWAGLDLATDDHRVPTLIASTSDPIASGILKNPEDSGHEHIHALIDPDWPARQVSLFHRIFSFSVLGLVYEDSLEGRNLSAVDHVFAMAEKHNFRVEACLAPFSNMGKTESENSAITCYKELADKVQAIYIVRHPGVHLASLPQILQPLLERKIPTFSQAFSDEVNNGVLLSNSMLDFSHIGDFYAMTIAKIFNGAKPANLKQTFRSPSKIAINLKTAQIIGYDPSFDVIGAADELFTEIAGKSPSETKTDVSQEVRIDLAKPRQGITE
jgi:ABC-type uncharacterized transport system substrate-binding protein